ncbi:matrix metalloproteinase-2-like [Temnothorax curvispinosus]|uniref:Matrix metalloproteinase-2-like n=1 Tax=Temnothorax curvispinosus TaxID=300111 RepID=A0A6J1RM24_9HYME|nr:matrix metalloproteinase-2-like [Temnothorax curvispinosus]
MATAATTTTIFVDLQGFTVSDRFVAKEMAVLRSETRVLPHHVFRAPMSWNLLTSSEKARASWLIANHHGLRWEDGDTDYRQAKTIIRRAVCDNLEELWEREETLSARIYVKGLEKKRWLQEILGDVDATIVTVDAEYEDVDRLESSRRLRVSLPASPMVLRHGEHILKHGTKANLSKWPKTHLTWHFHLAETELSTAWAAFDLWSQHSALTFERSETPNADIIISWRRLRHYNTNTKVNGAVCSDKFDGPGNVLAHASLLTDQEGFVSEVHVDGDEPWHIYVNKHSADRFSLHYTLTHEIGHFLGLVHNRRKTSVMFAIQPDQQYPVKLDQNDIADIQRLFGEKSTNEPPRRTPAPPAPPPPSLDLCSLDRVNGILILENRMYISYKRHVWSIDLDGRTYNGPLALLNHMSFLHDNYTRVTAAYQSPSGDLVVFVDNLVYLVQYPEFSLWPGWPKTLGRSFVVFNGNSVGEIDECDKDKRVAKFTPLEATFPGIPTGVTLIFRYVDGNLYFTTRAQFYKFNEFTRTVSSAGKFDLRILNIVCPRAKLLQ